MGIAERGFLVVQLRVERKGDLVRRRGRRSDAVESGGSKGRSERTGRRSMNVPPSLYGRGVDVVKGIHPEPLIRRHSLLGILPENGKL